MMQLARPMVARTALNPRLKRTPGAHMCRVEATSENSRFPNKYGSNPTPIDRLFLDLPRCTGATADRFEGS